VPGVSTVGPREAIGLAVAGGSGFAGNPPSVLVHLGYRS